MSKEINDIQDKIKQNKERIESLGEKIENFKNLVKSK